MRTITLKQKMIISLVSIAPGVINTLVVNALLVYYTDKLGMDNAILYGIAIMIFGVWNAINNPIIGVYIENWEPKSGKEKLKSLMKIGLPFMFLGFFLFTIAPKDSSDLTLFIFLLSGLIIFEFGKAIVEVASITFSLMIVTEPEQRSNLIMVMKVLEFVPMALVGVIPIIFLAPGKPYWQALVFILVVNTAMFIMSFLAIFKIEEPDDLFEQVKAQEEAGVEKPIVKAEGEAVSAPDKKSGIRHSLRLMVDSIKSTLGSNPFRILLLFRIFGALFQAAFVANITFMINWVVPITSDIGKLAILGFGGLIINFYYIIQNKLVKTWGMIKTIYVSFIGSFFGYVILFFANDFTTLFLGYILSNLGLAAIYMFSNVMIGDVADEDFVKTGKRRYSEFTANFAVFNSLAPAIALLIITLILQSSGYDGTSETGQTPSAIMGIRIVAAILPIIGLVLCTIMLKIYPLKGEEYAKMRLQFNKMVNSGEKPENPAELSESG
jgi:glycoside/pentoside/hexuronide:cation symporter, GPH family